MAVGRYSWIQDLGFYLVSAGILADAAGLFIWHRGGMSWNIGCPLLMLLGVDVCIIAVVNNGYTGSQNIAADIHQYCFYALGILTTLIPLCFAPGLWRWRPPWGIFSVAIGVSWLILGPIYLLVPTSWDGAYERFLALLAIAWLFAISDLLRRQGKPAVN